MKKTTLIYIVTFMTLAMMAIIALQLRFLDESYRLRSYIFDQTVNSALADVVKKVEKEEVLNFVKTKISAPKKVYYTHTEKPAKKNKSRQVTNNRTKQNAPKPERKFYKYTIPSGATVVANGGAGVPVYTPPTTMTITDDSIRVFSKDFSFHFPAGVNFEYDGDDLAALDFEMKEYDAAMEKHEAEMKKHEREMARVEIEQKRNDSIRFDRNSAKLSAMSHLRQLPIPPTPPDFHIQEVENFFEEAEKLNEPAKVFEELAMEMRVTKLPLSQRINSRMIDSLLREELLKRNITLPYKLQLKNQANDSVCFVSNAYNELAPTSPTNIYRTGLFEEKDNKESALISVYFPQKNKVLLHAMNPALISSSVLFLMIALSLAYVLRSILKQKKLSDMKNDFINNMTHEFKTPVSTILLASEALKDPLIVKDEPRLQRLAGIIYDENIRMSEHVERVLNMAKMEREELKLIYNPVDLHHLVQQALHKMELQLNTKNTQVDLRLSAVNSFLYADELHLKNIIFNLIDNANKYSEPDTTITIETQNTKSGILLSVKDQGIGMSKEQVKRIFEPFYRVPTGNLHNVKGFGLGLHYVHSIVKKLNGTITVKSEPGKGTEFSIYLPYNLQ